MFFALQFLIKLSLEEKEKLLKERDAKLTELKVLQGKTAKDLWVEDLDAFQAAYLVRFFVIFF